MPTLAQLIAGLPEDHGPMTIGGGPQLGSSNVDILNTIAQLNAGLLQYDPAWAKYIERDTSDPEHVRYRPRQGAGLGGGGEIMRDGKTYVQVGNIPNDGRILDQSKIQMDSEYGPITPIENVHVEESTLDRIMPYLVAAGFGGAALGAAGGFGGAAEGTAGFGVEGGATAGVGAGATGGGAADLAALGGASGALPETYWGMGADSGAIGTDAAVDGGMIGADTAPAGAFDVGGSTGFGGTTPLETTPWDRIVGGVQGGFDGAVSSAVNNPLGAARGVMGLASVIGGLSGSHNAAGGSQPGGVADILGTMADANRVNQTAPFGSRTWSQGADGRWGVTDAFSPQEQANYEGVRGMNANVTDLATRRLAAYLAGGAPANVNSAPFTWNGRTIGRGG